MPESRNQAFQSTRLRNIDFDMILIRQEEKQGKARKSKERIETRNQVIGWTRPRIIDFDMILKGF